MFVSKLCDALYIIAPLQYTGGYPQYMPPHMLPSDLPGAMAVAAAGNINSISPGAGMPYRQPLVSTSALSY